MLIKIQTVYPTYKGEDDVKFQKDKSVFINTDKIISISPYVNAWEIKMEGDVRPNDGYQHHFTLISDDEMTRIEPLLVEDVAPVPTSCTFESQVLKDVAVAYEAYKFARYEDMNTQDSIPLRNVLIAAGNAYKAQKNGDYDPYPPLNDPNNPTLPADEPVDWRILQGEFDSLSVAHQNALNAYYGELSEDNGNRVAETYEKLVAFLKRLRGQRWYHPHEPVLPDDVIAAHIVLACVLADTWSMEELYDAAEALSKALRKHIPADSEDAS